VAARFAAAGAQRVLDVGGGTGKLARLLPGLSMRCLLIDQSPAMLALAPRPAVRADGGRLPVTGTSVDAVAALFTLYHYADPRLPIREARRVLRPGGLFAACAPNRDSHPELAQVRPHWGGQEESIAQQPYVDMPANSAGRMYFYLGSPNSAYYDFIEFTVGTSSINVDTTRVDRFGLKLALLLHGHDGSNQEVGENYVTFQESRAATFARFQNSVPTQSKELATDQAPYGIPSPGNDPAFQPGGAYANYFTSYAAAEGDSSDSSAQIFGCGGTLAANPPLCAGLNRHVAQLPASEQSNPANFYQAAPANYYAQFWHQNAINGLQYGFPYDDDAGQSSDISITNPQYLVVAVGW
jgi:SAM-dependent methyltransferase